MSLRKVDLCSAEARKHLDKFRDLRFVEGLPTSQGRAARLETKALEVWLDLARTLYTEAATWIEEGEVVEFKLPEDRPCPPTGEALMLALALRDAHPPGVRWQERSQSELRKALNRALTLLSGSQGWRDSRWGKITLAEPCRTVVILPHIPRDPQPDPPSEGLETLVQAICGAMPKGQATRWAVEKGKDAVGATFESLHETPDALVVVAQWAGVADRTCSEPIQLGLALGGDPASTVTATDLFRAIRARWPSSGPQVLEFATCHGWRLAQTWNANPLINSTAFGYPGLRDTELVLHSIAELASTIPPAARPPGGDRALESAHNRQFGERVLLPRSREPLTFEVMRDLHQALWASTRYARIEAEEEPEYEHDKCHDVLAVRRGEAAEARPR